MGLRVALFVVGFVLIAAVVGAYVATTFGVIAIALAMVLLGVIGVALGVALWPRLSR